MYMYAIRAPAYLKARFGGVEQINHHFVVDFYITEPKKKLAIGI